MAMRRRYCALLLCAALVGDWVIGVIAPPEPGVINAFGYLALFGADGQLLAWDAVGRHPSDDAFPFECPIHDGVITSGEPGVHGDCPWFFVLGANEACTPLVFEFECSDGATRTIERVAPRVRLELGPTHFEVGAVENLPMGPSGRLLLNRFGYFELSEPCPELDLGREVDIRMRDPSAARACTCKTSADCPTGQFCDTLAMWIEPRCAPDKCAVVSCDNGVCDPYTGTCVEAGSCQFDEDCPGQFCNRQTGQCISPVNCANPDECGAGRICSIGTGCVGCLNDCDCPFGAQCDGGKCVLSCNDDALLVDRNNPNGHELLQVCITANDPAAVASLESTLAGWDCGYGGTFAPCKGGVEMACYKPTVADSTGAISDSQWIPLCTLSDKPFISSITSGSL